MKTIFTSAILLAFLSAHNAQASEASEQLATGGAALAGAIAGGPIGLIVGATLADHYLGQRKAKSDALARADALGTELGAAEQRLADERRASAELSADLEALRDENAALADDRRLLSELQFDIHFRTADASLSDSDKARLVRLAEFLKRHGELGIALHGHADARGADAVNDVLAMERARAVAQVLTGLDIDPRRIDARAFGEQHATAAGSDPDGLAYDRRVRVMLGAGELPGNRSELDRDLADADGVDAAATVAASEPGERPGTAVRDGDSILAPHEPR